MSNTIPLPEPDGLMHYVHPDGRRPSAWSEAQVHAHAAAVSAAKDARIRVLEGALRELVGACDDDSATRFEDALSAARAALGDAK